MNWDVNRLNDYLFKWVFGKEEHKDILLSFLNSVLSPEGVDEIVDISLAERELDPTYLQDKLSRLDILGRANDGSVINIEVQVSNEHNIDKRTLYYWAKLYQGQLQSGQEYKELCRTITINVLAFNFLPASQRHHSIFSLYDIKTGYRLNRDLEVHFLELPKWKALHAKPQNRLEKWLTYLSNNSSPQELEEIVMSEPAIQKALSAEELFLKRDKERYLYEMREKALHDYVSAMNSAKEEGLIQGIEQGLEQGIEQGIEKGIEKGIEQGIATVALRMLKRGVDMSEIVELTGIAREEIEKLRQ